MNLKKSIAPYLKQGWNLLFFGLLLFFVFSTDAKSWLLQRLVQVGLFKADIKKESPANLPEASLSFTDMHGNLVSTETLKGKVIFINFWASWCPPCLAEMPSLNNIYNKLKSDNRIIFLFVNEDEAPAAGLRLLEKKGYNLPFYRRAGNISSDIYSGTLPTTLIFNKEGKIVLKKEGLAGYDNEDFMLQLKTLM